MLYTRGLESLGIEHRHAGGQSLDVFLQQTGVDDDFVEVRCLSVIGQRADRPSHGRGREQKTQEHIDLPHARDPESAQSGWRSSPAPYAGTNRIRFNGFAGLYQHLRPCSRATPRFVQRGVYHSRAPGVRNAWCDISLLRTHDYFRSSHAPYRATDVRKD